MTEEEAHAWIRDRFGVSREALLARYAGLLGAEAANQNLIAASTLDTLWSRHLVDSAQLVPLAPAVRNPAVTELTAALPPTPGQHALCFTFTRASVDPIWAVAAVELVK